MVVLPSPLTRGGQQGTSWKKRGLMSLGDSARQQGGESLEQRAQKGITARNLGTTSPILSIGNSKWMRLHQVSKWLNICSFS